MIVAILTTVSVSVARLVVPPTAVIVTVILTMTVTVTVAVIVILSASTADCVRMCSQGGLVSPVRPPARRLATLP